MAKLLADPFLFVSQFTTLYRLECLRGKPLRRSHLGKAHEVSDMSFKIVTEEQQGHNKQKKNTGFETQRKREKQKKSVGAAA